MKNWWGGRDLAYMVQRLFLEHFCGTSFVIEKEEELVAFLIGFLSPDKKGEGYIHFAGVHPGYRKAGIGKYIYDCFADLCLENNCTAIRACTSPINKESVRFHTKIGFTIEEGDSEVDSIPVTSDYNRPDDPKVLFKKRVAKQE